MSTDLFDPPEIHDQLWGAVQRGYLGWDIGAGTGRTLQNLAARFTHVVAFEADDQHLPGLAKWGRTAHIHNVAIADHDGDIPWPGGGRKRCFSIDSLIHGSGLERPDFVNVDVAGAELAVLRGARSLIQLYRPQWLVEFYGRQSYEDCRQLLDNAGYRTETVRHPYYRPGSGPWHEHGWLKTAPSD